MIFHHDPRISEDATRTNPTNRTYRNKNQVLQTHFVQKTTARDSLNWLLSSWLLSSQLLYFLHEPEFVYRKMLHVDKIMKFYESIQLHIVQYILIFSKGRWLKPKKWCVVTPYHPLDISVWFQYVSIRQKNCGIRNFDSTMQPATLRKRVRVTQSVTDQSIKHDKPMHSGVS